MKFLLALMLVSIMSCYTYTEIPHAMVENARCACKNNGGVSLIKIKAAHLLYRTTLDSEYNFQCSDGLETGWWLYTGSMGPDEFIPLNKDCTVKMEKDVTR